MLHNNAIHPSDISDQDQPLIPITGLTHENEQDSSSLHSSLDSNASAAWEHCSIPNILQPKNFLALIPQLSSTALFVVAARLATCSHDTTIQGCFWGSACVSLVLTNLRVSDFFNSSSKFCLIAWEHARVFRRNYSQSTSSHAALDVLSFFTWLASTLGFGIAIWHYLNHHRFNAHTAWTVGLTTMLMPSLASLGQFNLMARIGSNCADKTTVINKQYTRVEDETIAIFNCRKRK